MGYIAALFAGGKVVTGACHGDAFRQLTRAEQEGDISSGFLDPRTGMFVTDDTRFYVKKIILIRHAEACERCHQCNQPCRYRNSPDPVISEYGRLQCEKAANFLTRMPLLHQYVGFACDCCRVKATAVAIFGQIGMPLQFSNRFCDPGPDETPYEFLDRVRAVIESLPENSIIVSHSDFVVNMAQIAMGTDITQCEQWHNKIPNCSITYVENHEPVWIGESPI